VTLAGPLAATGATPFAELAGPHSLWVRVQAGPAHAFARLPHTWLRYAYRALGFEAPAPPGPSDPTDADLSLTSFVLQQVAAEATQRSGLPVGVSAILPSHRIAALADPAVERWDGSRFALQIDEDRFEVEAIWPAADSRESAARLALPPWLLSLSYPISVCAGFLRLPARDLHQVDGGDILLPDRWLPTGWAAQESAELGPVSLALQGWTAPAELRFEKGYYHLQLASTWTTGAKGASMGDRAEALPEGIEGASVRIPDELEALVSFELERIAVPLQELLSWGPGATVRLQRTPEDPLRIVLRQAGQERLLGYGRVVVVEEKIGIQIERWLVEGQA
jgi:flagellar motor switch/type III secretory pathway protein FliN